MSPHRHRYAFAAVGGALVTWLLVVPSVGQADVARGPGVASRPDAGPSRAEGGHWMEPVELTATPAGYNLQPAWADIDEVGRQTVVWTAQPPAGPTIRTRRSTLDGTWGPVQKVAQFGDGRIDVRAVTSSDEGLTTIVYSHGGEGLLARQWYPDDTWSAEHSFGEAGTVVVADTGPNGRVAMLLGGSRATFVQSPAGVWRRGMLASPTPSDGFDVAFGPAGSPMAVWTTRYLHRVLTSTWRPAQGDWAEPESLGRPPGAGLVEADSNGGGDIVVALTADADGGGAHVLTTARRAGRSWRPLSPVTEPTNNAALRGVTVADDGSTLVGWYGRLELSSEATLTAALGRDFGRSWSAPQTLSDSVPNTFVDGDDAGTAVTGTSYATSSTGPRVAAVFRRAPGADGFDDEVAVLPAGMDSSLLDLDVGPDGAILALAVGPDGHLWSRSFVTP